MNINTLSIAKGKISKHTPNIWHYAIAKLAKIRVKMRLPIRPVRTFYKILTGQSVCNGAGKKFRH